jgi:hypothetical protein
LLCGFALFLDMLLLIAIIVNFESVKPQLALRSSALLMHFKPTKFGEAKFLTSKSTALRLLATFN